MIKESFRKYLEDAIGCENALVAFSAFDEPASVAVRYNPFKKTARMAGESVLWSRHGILLNERPVYPGSMLPCGCILCPGFVINVCRRYLPQAP